MKNSGIVNNTKYVIPAVVVGGGGGVDKLKSNGRILHQYHFSRDMLQGTTPENMRKYQQNNKSEATPIYIQNTFTQQQQQQQQQQCSSSLTENSPEFYKGEIKRLREKIEKENTPKRKLQILLNNTSIQNNSINNNNNNSREKYYKSQQQQWSQDIIQNISLSSPQNIMQQNILFNRVLKENRQGSFLGSNINEIYKKKKSKTSLKENEQLNNFINEKTRQVIKDDNVKYIYNNNKELIDEQNLYYNNNNRKLSNTNTNNTNNTYTNENCEFNYNSNNNNKDEIYQTLKENIHKLQIKNTMQKQEISQLLFINQEQSQEILLLKDKYQKLLKIHDQENSVNKNLQNHNDELNSQIQLLQNQCFNLSTTNYDHNFIAQIEHEKHKLEEIVKNLLLERELWKCQNKIQRTTVTDKDVKQSSDPPFRETLKQSGNLIKTLQLNLNQKQLQNIEEDCNEYRIKSPSFKNMQQENAKIKQIGFQNYEQKLLENENKRIQLENLVDYSNEIILIQNLYRDNQESTSSSNKEFNTQNNYRSGSLTQFSFASQFSKNDDFQNIDNSTDRTAIENNEVDIKQEETKDFSKDTVGNNICINQSRKSKDKIQEIFE